MKISKISLNCRRDTSVNGTASQDFSLYLFKTPVIFIKNGSEQRLNGGTAIIFSSGSRQYFRPVKAQPMRYDLVSFRLSSADKTYIVSLDVPLDTPVKLSDDFVISSTLKSMNSQFLLRSVHYSEFMELSMRIIFLSVTDAYNAPPIGLQEEIPHYAELSELRDNIYADPVSAWQADDMSGSLGISRTYFHRLYLAAFGVTCRRDIIESRLSYACELLKNTDMSVSAIAEKCGYESDSYFMRQFRQYRNCTPTEYRRRVFEYDD